ncbi:glycosyl hydrolase family 18 protein [Vibrio aestuarianus]|uniref:glycosyl hydrolase family 18 protein n=1 Tax=Vibrio aestuarianus TaxID=28171 RepID=UPI00237CB17B|nr:glycosyl hydrolase family 18 protein [Vibrio aestuarianus]MDE1336109.1 glycosyl hydrolase family 18 protein [Vibrio aestuarianus]
MKLQKTQLSILVGLTLMTGLASAAQLEANFSRGDVRFLTQAEFFERQPTNPMTEAYGPLNFSSPQLYNEYNQNASLPKVEAYMSNWGQYGRKWSAREIAKLSNVYDTIVFSFLGMCGTEVGDPDITSAVESLRKYTCNTNINPQAKRYEVMITDMWGDLAAAIPDMVGVIGQPEISDFTLLMQKWYAGQNNVNHGALGALKKLHSQSPGTNMAFSVGGWSLSHLFSEMAATRASRRVFIDSIVAIFNKYPMFSQVDIDWEYPGIKTGNNIWSVNDKDNYKLLIRELRNALNAVGKNDVKIAVAAGAPQEKLDASGLKGLIDEGVDIIHLMTYDFFGSWHDWGLAHHTNLFDYEGSEWSIDKSVTYMIEELKIDPKNIFIGYANYSRNATNAKISSQSPLQGDHLDPYDTTGKYVGGSWEKGVYEWYDIEQEFLSINPNSGLSVDKARHAGYQLLTDKEANADYIYSNDGEFFMSFDTPRSVYAKAKYVKEKGLGGIFNWMADYDTGLMVNAAREGLGYTKTGASTNIDMTNIIYSCGENITSQEECEALTNLSGGSSAPSLEADAGRDVSARFVAGQIYRLDGSKSTGSDISYKWTIKKRLVTGVDADAIVLRQARSASPKIHIPDGVEVEDTIKIPVKLVVTDSDGMKADDTVILTLTSGEVVNHPPVAEAAVDKTEIVRGEVFTLNGSESSDVDGDELTYAWRQVGDESVDLGNKNRQAITVSTEALENIDQTLKFRLTVRDGQAADSAVVAIHVSPSEEGNGENVSPIARASATPRTLNYGESFQLNGRQSSDADGDSLTYQWTQVNGESVNLGDATRDRINVDTSSLSNTDQTLSFSLRVSDGQASNTALVSVSVSATNSGGNPGGDYDYEFPAGFGSYAAGTVVKFPQGVYECFGDWAAHCNTQAFLPGVAADPNWITQQWRFLRSE